MEAIIGLTLGDPAGIGPEIIVKAFQDELLSIDNRVLVIGDAELLKRTAETNCSGNSHPFGNFT